MTNLFVDNKINIMMKRTVILILLALLIHIPSCEAVDRYSKEYLQGRHHFAIINPVVECAVEKAIKSQLRKETGAEFDVKFTGYTTSSMKKGIFKSFELSTDHLLIDDNIPITDLHVKSETDYNYIDYTKNPLEFKSDMIYSYDMVVTDEALNIPLKDRRYKKIIENVNNIAYPLFEIKEVQTRIKNDRLYIVMGYSSPLKNSPRIRQFVVSSDIKIENGRVKTTDLKFDSKYGNLGLGKVANLINLLNPMEFALEVLKSQQCRVNIENAKIIDDKIKINGKIFVEGNQI